MKEKNAMHEVYKMAAKIQIAECIYDLLDIEICDTLMTPSGDFKPGWDAAVKALEKMDLQLEKMQQEHDFHESLLDSPAK